MPAVVDNEVIVAVVVEFSGTGVTVYMRVDHNRTQIPEFEENVLLVSKFRYMSRVTADFSES